MTKIQAALDVIATAFLQSICETLQWDLEADDEEAERQLEETLEAIAAAIQA
jgi:hypothetical protein